MSESYRSHVELPWPAPAFPGDQLSAEFLDLQSLEGAAQSRYHDYTIIPLEVPAFTELPWHHTDVEYGSRAGLVYWPGRSKSGRLTERFILNGDGEPQRMHGRTMRALRDVVLDAVVAPSYEPAGMYINDNLYGDFRDGPRLVRTASVKAAKSQAPLLGFVMETDPASGLNYDGFLIAPILLGSEYALWALRQVVDGKIQDQDEG